MSDEMVADDQSHYEISLTAGQAFVAFILLLLSLAASFGFGLMIGKGQAEDRLIVRKEPAVINEASMTTKKPAGRLVELGVADDDFQKPKPAEVTATDTTGTVLTESTPPPASTPEATATVAETPRASVVKEPDHRDAELPAYAQLMSTSDQKSAEALATKLIEKGFTSAYVERGTNAKGNIFRVRVKFSSETEAHAAEPKLKEFSKDIWITK